MQNPLIVDLRSESEFKSGSIVGAINIPILNDKEREEVGYTYVNEDVCHAKRLAIRYASVKLEGIFDKFSYEFSQGKNLILFCARGGMRSGSVHTFFNSIGIKTYKLDKGYKGYRKYLRDTLPTLLDRINFIVIHGKTGVGKTKILNMLKQKGYPVIDLEKAANHRASFLGGVNLGEQNSQKQFESILFNDVMEIVNGREDKVNVFIEGESKRIGKIILPNYVFDSMERGTHVFYDIPKDIRIENLMEDYFKVDPISFRKGEYNVSQEIKEEFKECLSSLERYASSCEMEKYFLLFEEENYKELALSLIESYYDPKYIHAMKKHEFKYKFECSSSEQALRELIGAYENVLKNG